MPAHARQLAEQLSALFDSDVEIAARLNDAQHRLQDANELLWSALAPDAFGLIDDGPAAPIGSSPNSEQRSLKRLRRKIHCSILWSH